MRRRVEIGILHSSSGDYCAIAAASRAGALAGVSDVNASAQSFIEMMPVLRDPRGQVDLYAPLCHDILTTSRARHVIGCATSSSRKEVLPVIERHGATLWYALPYEGFEASDHAVYMHACPNQHLLPLLDWALPRFGTRVHLVGSNYIWGWEINRLAREVVANAGGSITAERHLPMGEIAVASMVEEIADLRPDFVLNSLVGTTQYAFVAALRAVRPDLPVLSCNLTECELPRMGGAAEGLIAAGPYFAETGTGFANSHAAAAHASVIEMARLFERHEGGEDMPLAELLALDQGAGPIDFETHHTALPVLIAEVRDGAFQVLRRLPPVPGDPYLARHDRRAPARAQLRLVP
ncbi:N-acetylmuramoyl-L-alanine amidase [Paracoccus suum]|uniref:N-acetylmuramoyl-L-alanine amidase n=1 Tax=Paracoccus suum TaxID=2259340 RepID=A0A344PGA1_9RHOB|nr:transporter substrate-binding protein [Paracoccus suum]AXC48406.1 N-acetylmuramoyl-L-alanine amidase [Paracoccus suum]